jgi:hypothetical protein
MGMRERGYVRFREVQHIRQLWPWIVVLVIVGLVVWAAVQQFAVGKPFGNQPMSDTGLIIVSVVFGIGLPVFLYSVTLTTEVTDDGLYYRFFPLNLSFNRLGPDDIRSFEVRTYGALREYGGWGIRRGAGGRIYSTGGNRGVEVVLRGGNRVMFGSQRPEELAGALASLKPSIFQP